MSCIDQILVIVDPTAASQPAIAKAALLAENCDARLELFVCDTKAARELRFLSHAQSHPGEAFPLSTKAFLESQARPLRARGLDVTTEALIADPLHIGLIERTRHTHADLVVKDTHHHSLAQRTFLTNTDWELIRGCPAPLLLTRGAPWATAPRILAAVDPGHVNDKPEILDRCIMEYAALFARQLQGELQVLHAYLPLAILSAASAASPPLATAVTTEDLALEERTRRELLAPLVDDYCVAADKVHLQMGGPAQVLPRAAASLQADVLVMGAIARSGLQRIFLGSTAEDVLEHLPCDALIVKPPAGS